METLIQYRNEIVGRLRSRDIRIEQYADPVEKMVASADMERECRRVEEEHALLRRIDAALERERAGEYGLCVDCGVMMPDRRLLALPWAERCVPCQEAEEMKG